MNRMITLLIKAIGGVETMPTYIPQKRGDYLLDVTNRDFKRSFGIFKEIPFYNGTNICLNLTVSMPRRKVISEDFTYSWGLYEDDKERPIRSGGERTLHFSNKKRRILGIFLKGEKHKEYSYDSDDKYSEFTIYKAIDIGRLSLMNANKRYQLRLRLGNIAIESEQMSIMEFTLQNRDDILGSTIVSMILSVIFGAIAGLIASFLYAIFSGGGK